MLDKNELLTSIMLYLYIIVFCLLGAIIKDTYNTITNKIPKVEYSRVFVSTIVASIIIFSLSDFILERINYKVLILISFAGGMIGFDLLKKITKLSFWVSILTKNKDAISKIIDDAEKEDDVEKEDKI